MIVALFCAWKLGIHSYEQALLLGLFLGMAGASFAVIHWIWTYSLNFTKVIMTRAEQEALRTSGA